MPSGKASWHGSSVAHAQWAANGLGEPDEVRMATATYRGEQDILATFISERCLVGPALKTKAGDIYSDYAKWAEEAGGCATQRRLGKLSSSAVSSDTPNNGVWYRGSRVEGYPMSSNSRKGRNPRNQFSSSRSTCGAHGR